MILNSLFANRSWFNFSVNTSEPGFDTLGVYAFSGVERVNVPYEFAIEVVSKSSNLNLTDALGKECLLTIVDKSKGTRLVHGVIRQMEQLHTANVYTHYLIQATPRLWFLSQTQDHRIYQFKTVPQIIQIVLGKHRFTEGAYDFKLREKYQEREYCVQYGESDLHFIDRLCEEEGIYYFHEHRENGHCLCFSDAEGGPSILGENNLRFYPGSGQPEDTTVISRLKLRHRINSDKAVYHEWNFTAPSIDLTSSEYEPEGEKAPVPVAMELETYQFPHLYQTLDEGDRYAKLQLARQLTFRQWIECETDVSRHLPGFTFTLNSHPRDDANRGWWVVEVRQEGKQPGVLEHESPDSRGLEYKAVVTAIPDDTRFIPEINHKKVRIEGLQSAIVTGLSGEEIYPDQYGRVKVQFQWDRLGNHDEHTTCWVRVADSWAGENFGFIQLPRIDQEVLVEFMEGDPDRPVITGRVYNAAKMPPWELPGQKALSGIQSREIRGGRRNQLVLDDTQNQIQAQLSSDHDLSQLNLGYITRVNHVDGRNDFRGEGFELRTDGWGVMRAAKGLYISTDARPAAQAHQKDINEATGNIQNASSQHEETAKLAAAHKAQDAQLDGDAIAPPLRQQADALRGSGKPHGELTESHMVLSSPAGIAITTPHSTHLHTIENTAITTGRHLSVSTGKSFLVSALDKVSLFAQNLGMRFFAGKGKVEIQAQSDDMDIIAEKILQIISTKKSIHITAAEEVTLAAGGSYIRVDKHGIESGTKNKWVVHAATHTKTGPDSLNPPMPNLPEGAIQFNDKYCVRDLVTGDPIANMKYELHKGDGSIVNGVTGEDGIIPMQNNISPDKIAIKLLGKK